MMQSTYVQKNTSAQNTAVNTAASVLDNSLQSQNLQRKATFTNGAVQRVAASLRPNNTGLPDSLKNNIESLSGYSLDSVRVHYNSSKPAAVQAYAYTQGTDIHIAPGQESCLPHEAWHVTQQMSGRVSATTSIGGVAVNDDASLEHEADVMGARAAMCGTDQENATSSNSLSVNDGSAYGLSLQRKASAMQNNMEVMQRKAWVATKPLDKLTEVIGSSPMAIRVFEFAKKIVKEKAVDFAKTEEFDSLVNNWEDSKLDAIDSDSSIWSEEKEEKKKEVSSNANHLRSPFEGPSIVGTFFDLVNVCDTPQGEACYDTCYNPEVNYKEKYYDNVLLNYIAQSIVDSVDLGLWHKHIIFNPDDLNERLHYEGTQGENCNVDENIRERIRILTKNNVPGPSNIGFRAEENSIKFNAAGLNSSFVGTGKLFSEEVLHKNYTQGSQISDSVEQDLDLMEAIEQHAPGVDTKYDHYDLLHSNCQQWVDDVKKTKSNIAKSRIAKSK